MESLHSKRNRIFLNLRSALRFRRPGYREEGKSLRTFSEAEMALTAKYQLEHVQQRLSPEVFQKNLATLWILEQILDGSKLPPAFSALEPGCQDFSRLPALRAFFRYHRKKVSLCGIELDAFPILNNLHSRWDKALYYISLERDGTEFQPGDFFRWKQPSELIFSFYPFVSPDPALAWGLPSTFGDGKKWAESFAYNLKEDGLLLVVHQGKWEEEEFDECREGQPFELLARKEVPCPFYPLPHPACASLYRRLPHRA
jgi:hypothetical protein